MSKSLKSANRLIALSRLYSASRQSSGRYVYKEQINMRYLLILLVLLPALGYAEERICKGNNDIVDDCYAIRGRLSLYSGTPSMRIWKVGTKRLLAVIPSEDEIIPNNLQKQIGIDKLIYGDFMVCPFEKEKEGYMQSVCIESAKNMRVEDYSDNLNKPKITFIKE